MSATGRIDIGKRGSIDLLNAQGETKWFTAGEKPWIDAWIAGRRRCTACRTRAANAVMAPEVKLRTDWTAYVHGLKGQARAALLERREPVERIRLAGLPGHTLDGWVVGRGARYDGALSFYAAIALTADGELYWIRHDGGRFELDHRDGDLPGEQSMLVEGEVRLVHWEQLTGERSDALRTLGETLEKIATGSGPLEPTARPIAVPVPQRKRRRWF